MTVFFFSCICSTWVILLLLTFTIFFFRIRSVTLIHICISNQNLICKLNTTSCWILFNPRCFRFQTDRNSTFLRLECLNNNSLINTRDHIWWFNKWEWKRRSQHNSWISVIKWSFDKRKGIAKSLSLREDSNLNILLSFHKHFVIFRVILWCTFHISCTLLHFIRISWWILTSLVCNLNSNLCSYQP